MNRRNVLLAATGALCPIPALATCTAAAADVSPYLRIARALDEIETAFREVDPTLRFTSSISYPVGGFTLAMAFALIGNEEVEMVLPTIVPRPSAGRRTD